MRSVDSATLAGSYVTLGTPIAHPSYVLKIVNNSNVLVTISTDGVTDEDVLPSDGFFIYDEDKTPDHVAVPTGTQFYVKGSAGAGLIYLVTQYIVQA